jgi:hypothetical protein
MVRHAAHQVVAQELAWSVTAFGSQVWGVPDRSSDVDVFVVAGPRHVAGIHRVFARVSMRIHRPVEVSIESGDSVAFSLRDPSSLAARVALGGRLLAGGPVSSLVAHEIVSCPEAARRADARWHLARAESAEGERLTHEVLAAAARWCEVPSWYPGRRGWWPDAVAEALSCPVEVVVEAIKGRPAELRALVQAGLDADA